MKPIAYAKSALIAWLTGLVIIFTTASFIESTKSLFNMHFYSYLALGDSYTIGESVLLTENFPSQTVQLLRKAGHDFYAPEIIAKTGWTTDELQAAIDTHHFRTRYDFVSLLIGVNNQYRGRSVAEYEKEFTALLKQAIQFAGNDTAHVAVISIPDWGVTPFAEGRDRQQVAREIDAYNRINKKVSGELGVHYIDITPWTREAAANPALLAADGLHPSSKEYLRWSEKLADFIKKSI
jgi:lysophospholipase L1-like esterase